MNRYLVLPPSNYQSTRIFTSCEIYFLKIHGKPKSSWAYFHISSHWTSDIYKSFSSRKVWELSVFAVLYTGIGILVSKISVNFHIYYSSLLKIDETGRDEMRQDPVTPLKLLPYIKARACTNDLSISSCILIFPLVYCDDRLWIIR